MKTLEAKKKAKAELSPGLAAGYLVGLQATAAQREDVEEIVEDVRRKTTEVKRVLSACVAILLAGEDFLCQDLINELRDDYDSYIKGWGENGEQQDGQVGITERDVASVAGLCRAIVSEEDEQQQQDDLQAPATGLTAHSGAEAKALLTAYYSRFVKNNHHNQSPLVKAEMDLALCYLAGMTAKNTATRITENHGFKTSKSAVGRYWKRFTQVRLVV